MPIEPDFRKKREKVSKDEGIAIWGPVDPPEKLGIRGTNVAVDWDLCEGCGICLEVCPVHLYEWRKTSGHPTSQKKAFPARESDCVECLACENQCPVQSVRVTPMGFRSGWERTSVLIMLAQITIGIIHGALFGPYLSLKIPFYVGWFVFAVGSVFFILGPYELVKRGEIDRFTTVLVDSGIFAVVRHPMLLGCMLFMSASMLISQHWLSIALGVPIIVWFYIDVSNDDKRLILKFGDDYKRYMQKVPRLNPILGVTRLLLIRKRE